MYDWNLKYGENQQHEMRSGYKFATEELAREHGEDFIAKTNRNFVHYPNAKIDVVEIDE